MLIETINALNLEAVAAYFVADVTHTVARALRDVAADGRARGFDDAQVVFLNPDQRATRDRGLGREVR